MSPPRALQFQLDWARPNFRLQLNLTLPGQGVSVLFGPSGSGKTSLLRCVAGLARAQGRVVIGDEIWQDSAQGRWVPTHARDLGYVFQEASLFEHLDVRANLRYGMQRVTKANAKNAQDALNAAIALLGIGPLLERKPQSLSGGERQRVAIARALATQPKILLLDEPLASLDLARRHEILPWLERMQQQLHLPILYVTHAMEELTRLADHVVLLERGQVKVQGAIAHVLSNPVFAATVGGEAGVVLRGVVRAHDTRYHLSCIDLDGTHLWLRQRMLAIGSPVRLHIHANDVSLALHEPQGSSIQNVLTGVIAQIDEDFHAASCLVTIRHAQHTLLARITRKAAATLSLRVGTPVWAQIKSVALAEH